mmetsp:Transcript_34512/g.81827  ORF Transcript_34512/g.81827 Transcript_34512/m.81827 type:complete len:398 (+) Transcript_34512:412-1605(+)
MVKSATLNSFIPEVSVKDYWDVLYAADSAVVEFHNKFHGQQEVGVTEWVDGKRVVDMEVPLSLPAFLRTFAGRDRVPVRETQEYRWSESDRLEISSTPISQIPGGAKFNTQLEYIVEEQPEGVNVTAKVFSHASGPFGLSGAIEGVMLEVGIVQTKQWLEYSRQRCMSSPGKWWQQAGKLSRALSRRVTGSRAVQQAAAAADGRESMSEALDKIQTDLGMLEALEPPIDLGSAVKDILQDAQLKQQYTKTMMTTLFMLETAEDSKLDLSEEQARELREMLIQLQRSLASITRRKDELIGACLSYEAAASERQRALAQELQRERVRAEKTEQANITLRAQIAELKRQITASREPPGQRARGGRSRGFVLLRRLFLAGAVVLVGHWALDRRKCKAGARR